LRFRDGVPHAWKTSGWCIWDEEGRRAREGGSGVEPPFVELVRSMQDAGSGLVKRVEIRDGFVVRFLCVQKRAVLENPPLPLSLSCDAVRRYAAGAVLNQLETIRFNHLIRATGSASDVVQDVLLAIAPNLERFDPSRGGWRPFLGTCVENALRNLSDHYSRDKRDWQRVVAATDVGISVEFKPVAPVSGRYEACELIESLYRNADPGMRDAIWGVARLGVAGAAKLLDIPQSTLRARLIATGKHLKSSGWAAEHEIHRRASSRARKKGRKP
jgi:DNA-directed RNA polymerase specialized sigma24 family protein